LPEAGTRPRRKSFAGARTRTGIAKEILFALCDVSDEEVVVEGYRSSVGSWDLTAEGLYFVDQESSSSSGMSWVVRFQGFDRRHATEVARLRYPPFLAGPAISVSSDGRWMLSTQSQAESDLTLVETFR
jgi:hypothetical protein